MVTDTKWGSYNALCLYLRSVFLRRYMRGAVLVARLRSLNPSAVERSSNKKIIFGQTNAYRSGVL